MRVSGAVETIKAAAALRAHAGVVIRARAVALVAVQLWREALVEEARIPTVGLTCVAATPRLGVPSTMPRVGEVRGGTLGPGSGSWAVPAPASGPRVGPDPTGLRTLADTVLRLARDDVAAHAEQVTALLDQLCEGMPDGEFRLSDVGMGLVDWAAGMLRMAATWHPVRMLVDPEGALADTRDVYDGLELTVRTLADDPHEANRLLLDSQTWHDEPGRWVGRMAPDALLTAVAGVGVATRGAGRLSAAVRALEDLRPTPRPAPTPRVWTSKDSLVGELATRLEAEHPGLVVGVNEWLPTFHGSRHEVDIDLGRLAIEVKTGRARGVTGQLAAIMTNTGRRPILYAPDIPTVTRFHVLSEGFAVARTYDELLEIIKELM